MAEHESKWEEVPSYYDAAGGMYNYFTKNIEEFQNSNYSFPWTTVDDAVKYFRVDVWDVLLVVVMALIWTGIRHFFTEWIFKPVGKHFDLTASNQRKMPESAWKFLYFFSIWSFTLYIVELKGSYAFFRRPSTIWDGWTLDLPLPTDFYILYVVQFSFYLHSLYATIFQDVWRRDSAMMVVHHILVLMLIFLSYAVRCHKCGALVILFHDISDVQLEFTKLMVYFKIQGGKLVKVFELIANVGFCLFALTWYISRLYWYPLKAMNAACNVLAQSKLLVPFSFTMNLLLLIIEAMNINWFLLIVEFVWRIASGQINEVDDTREYDVIERSNQQSESVQNKKKDISTYNGIAGNNKRPMQSTEDNKETSLVNGEGQYQAHKSQARARR